MSLAGWSQIQLKVKMENSRPTTRLIIYLVFLIYINQTWSHVLQMVCPKPIMIVYDLLQVVVQQLNFVERSISSLPLYDRDSNSMMAGKTHSEIEKSFLLCLSVPDICYLYFLQVKSLEIMLQVICP